MWEIKQENAERLRMIKNVYYANILDVTRVRISQVMTGSKCKTILAMGIISICYGITLNDEQMKSLLEKHFSRID